MENNALAVLRSGSLLSDDLIFFLIVRWVDERALREWADAVDSDSDIHGFCEIMQDIYIAHGLPRECWRPWKIGQGPKEFDYVAKALKARFFLRFGQPFFAALVEEDYGEFERRFVNGFKVWKRGKRRR
jgi:hypothetical protein